MRWHDTAAGEAAKPHAHEADADAYSFTAPVIAET